MKSPRATKINPACSQRPSGEVLFQRRPRSRRSSNEVAPSAGGGGGARDLRSRFSSSSPVRRGIVSVGRPPLRGGIAQKGAELSLRQSVGRKTALLRSARVAATSGGASYSTALVALSAGVGPLELSSFGRRKKLRFVESPALAVPLGTPTGGLHNLRGVGDGPNFL